MLHLLLINNKPSSPFKVIWVLWLFQQQLAASIFSRYWSGGGIFPRGAQKQFHVWASRDQPVENWYSYTAPQTCGRLPHTCTIYRAHGSHLNKQTYTVNVESLWCIIQICLFLCWIHLCSGKQLTVVIYTHSTHTSHTHLLSGVFNFCFLFFPNSSSHTILATFAVWLRWRAGRIRTLFWSGTSSVSTTTLRGYSQQNSLQKRGTDSSAFIPKPWQNCTPPYSWPNYPGPV